MKKIFALLLTFLLVFSCLPISAFAISDREKDKNMDIIYDYLHNMLSLCDPVCVAIVTNAYYGSGCDPTYVSDDGKLHGIFQWSDKNGRWAEVVAYCESAGYDYNTLDGQLAFIYNDFFTLRNAYYGYLVLLEDDYISKNITCATVVYDVAYFFNEDYGASGVDVNSSERARFAADFMLRRYCPNLPDSDYEYDAMYSDNKMSDADLESNLKDAINFIKSLPRWLSWLPNTYIMKLDAHFTLIITLCGALIILKIAHG